MLFKSILHFHYEHEKGESRELERYKQEKNAGKCALCQLSTPVLKFLEPCSSGQECFTSFAYIFLNHMSTTPWTKKCKISSIQTRVSLT
jgi:hypothetical protein